jgi:hypothetical protein
MLASVAWLDASKNLMQQAKKREIDEATKMSRSTYDHFYTEKNPWRILHKYHMFHAE